MKSPEPARPRVLIVDDESAILHATRAYLTVLGYSVDCAREREEAEALLATTPYAVLITDMRLTGMHGREGLELLSFAREHSSATRAIVVTAYGSPELAEASRALGADAYLEKPVALSDVARTVAALLDEAP
jgi:two-component system response regulator PilR (NtrC family)